MNPCKVVLLTPLKGKREIFSSLPSPRGHGCNYSFTLLHRVSDVAQLLVFYTFTMLAHFFLSALRLALRA